MEELAKKLQRFIDYEVSKTIETNTKYERLYKSILEILDEEITHARKLKTDCANDELTINAVEWEGYLRALLTMQSKFKHIEQYY